MHSSISRNIAAAATALIFFGTATAFAASANPGSTDTHVSYSIAQEDASDEDAPIPADQVSKYIAVYSAMQRDHSVTVDQAASKQGMSVAQFRDLEDRIERNPVVHEHVMESLKPKSAAAQAAGKKKPEAQKDAH